MIVRTRFRFLPAVLAAFLCALPLLAGGCRTSSGSSDPVTPPHTPEVPNYWLGEDVNPAAGTTRTESLDAIFDVDTLGDMVLTFTEAEWNTLLAYYDQNERNETCVHGDFAYQKDGMVWRVSDAGIRLRGNTSRVRPEGDSGETHNTDDPADYHQAHFKVDFEEWLADGAECKMSGAMKGVILKRFKDDPNHVREIYSYDLFRRYGVWTAPRASYTTLTIRIGDDTAYYGVYEMVEDIDKQFLKARKESGSLASDKGDLWKCCWQAGDGPDLVERSSYSMGVEEISLNESESLRYDYDLKTNKDDLAASAADFSAFISELNALDVSDTAALTAWFEAHTDPALLIKTLAVNVACGMWDDYWSNKNNYYLYFDSAKFYFIPYDYDNTLGVSLNAYGDSGTKNPLYWGDAAERPLVNKLLSVPAYRDSYVAALRELCDDGKEYFGVTPSQSRIRAWQALIAESVANDTDDYQSIYDEPAGWGDRDDYRLLSGNATTNFFLAKAAAVSAIGSSYTVTFDSNGGSAVAARTGAMGESLVSTVPVYEGHLFAGWYSDDGTFLNRVASIPGTCTLYARWLLPADILDYTVSGDTVTFTFHPAWYDLRAYTADELTAVYLRGGFDSWAIDPAWSLTEGSDGNWTLAVAKSLVSSGQTFKFFLYFNGAASDSYSWFGGNDRVAGFETPSGYADPADSYNLVLLF